MPGTPPRVFLSYAHEGDGTHADWVLSLSKRLRGDGVDAWIDRYEPFPLHGWRPWMAEQIETARWVLVVCTPEYKKRFDGNAPAHIGLGVRWESQHITQQLYDDQFRNVKFVPVLPEKGERAHIPVPLRDYRSFALPDQYEDLYRLLTDQPATPAPTLGLLRKLAPLEVPDPDRPISASPAPTEIANPYPGLAAFRPENARFFYGRDQDIARVVEHLGRTRLVSLIGPSGTGKSSLVAAGVYPKLCESHANLLYLRFTPQASPLQEIAAALDRVLPEERIRMGSPRSERIVRDLAADPVRGVNDLLASLDRPVLVLVDQGEELFTRRPPGDAKDFRAVVDALARSERAWVVLTLRHEFMHHLVEWLGRPAYEQSQCLLDPMQGDENLRAIVCRPAEDCRVAVAPALASRLIAEARSTRGALPLIALALQRIFAGRDPASGMTLAAYEAMGGLEGVVRTAAADIDAAIAANPALERAAERLFGELATVIDELPTRRTAEAARLRADSDVGTLLDALRSQGFVTDLDDARVELAHEALLTHWTRLRDWCQAYSDQLALRGQAERAAKEWQRARDAEDAAGARPTTRRSDAMRWTWERQKPALEAMVALAGLSAVDDPDFTDAGIHAWRALEHAEDALPEPLRTFLHPEPLRLLEELNTDATSHNRREEIGLRLSQMGDPRPGVGLDANGLPDIVWVEVPGGEVTLEDESKTTRTFEGFEIARYPITWQQYRAFLEADDGYRDSRWWEHGDRDERPGDARWDFGNYPVINVSWFDAMALCRWLSVRWAVRPGRVIRLPTEWEWQWVAQNGPDGFEYPWPNGWSSDRANSGGSGIGRTMAVGMYPRGAPRRWSVILFSSVDGWNVERI